MSIDEKIKQLNVLIVEDGYDNIKNAKKAEDLLAKKGYDVNIIRTTSLATGSDILDKGDIDLMVTDYKINSYNHKKVFNRNNISYFMDQKHSREDSEELAVELEGEVDQFMEKEQQRLSPHHTKVEKDAASELAASELRQLKEKIVFISAEKNKKMYQEHLKKMFNLVIEVYDKNLLGKFDKENLHPSEKEYLEESYRENRGKVFTKIEKIMDKDLTIENKSDYLKHIIYKIAKWQIKIERRDKFCANFEHEIDACFIGDKISSKAIATPLLVKAKEKNIPYGLLTTVHNSGQIENLVSASLFTPEEATTPIFMNEYGLINSGGWNEETMTENTIETDESYLYLKNKINESAGRINVTPAGRTRTISPKGEKRPEDWADTIMNVINHYQIK